MWSKNLIYTDILPSMGKISLEARFWSKVDKSGECWLWLGGRNEKQYGILSVFIDKKHHNKKAHRIVWELTYGNIPDGMLVCHKCDNPPCCNPTHLFLGTHKDNVRDMMSKNRGGIHKGSSHNRKLTYAEACHIREVYREGNTTYKQLASLYGVSKITIRYIIKGIYYKSV